MIRLLELQAESPTGQISLTSEQWEELAMSKDRPYHFIVFSAASSLMNSAKTQLGKLHDEFGLAAQVGGR